MKIYIIFGVSKTGILRLVESRYTRPDIAAHGDAPIVGEEEAFTRMMLLLRFARFAEERWSDITKP
jgi:hypothetical protein